MTDIKLPIKILMNHVLDVYCDFDDLTQSLVRNWDSIAHLNLIIEIELSFGISIEPDEIIQMTDFNSVYLIVSKKLNLI